MLVIVLSGVALSFLAAYLSVRKRRTEAVATPPMYPGAWPILGHVPYLWNGTKGLLKLLEDATQYEDKRKQTSYTFKVINLTFYAMADPEDCLTVANTCLDKDRYLCKFGQHWVGDGLLLAKSDIWKRHRKLLNKALNQQILDGFLEVFNNQAKLLTEKFECNIGKGPFDHLDIVNLVIWDTMYSTIMGLEHNEYANSTKNEYLHAVHGMFEVAMARFLRCWLYYDLIFNRSHLRKKADDSLRTILKISKTMNLMKSIEDLIGKVNNTQKEAPNDKDEDEQAPVLSKAQTMEKKNLDLEKNLNKTETKDYMDLILALWKNGEFTKRQAVHHVNTMMVAGHDTVATAVGTLLVVLGSYPDVQNKIYQELQEILGDSHMKVEKQHIGQLKYMEAVIKETLRLYPTAPFVVRRVDQDVKLNNYTLEAGSSVILGLRGLNRHPVWGVDVHQFRPERWLNRDTLPENPNVFASFSIGRRNCIGINYAMMTMKTFLAHIVRRFRVTADITKTEFQFYILMKPAAGHYISIEER